MLLRRLKAAELPPSSPLDRIRETQVSDRVIQHLLSSRAREKDLAERDYKTMLSKFTIKRKISDTLLGAIYECERRVTAAETRHTSSKPVHRHHSSVAVKCSSMRYYHHLITTSKAHDPSSSIDDPRRECRVVTKLIASGGHENVVQCFDHFVSKGDGDKIGGEDEEPTLCVVTEFCSGGDLFSYLRASPKAYLVESEVVRIMLQVVAGVSFLHSVGIAHRDLSLENVLLRRGVCKITDFGAATSVGERCVDCVGKHQYMAPEVVACGEGSAYDPVPADVWSLGIMLFVLLTGSPLVGVASSGDVGYEALRRHGIGSILVAWGFDVELVSVDLVALLTGMLERDPSQRLGVHHVIDRLNELAARSAERDQRLACL